MIVLYYSYLYINNNYKNILHTYIVTLLKKCDYLDIYRLKLFRYFCRYFQDVIQLIRYSTHMRTFEYKLTMYTVNCMPVILFNNVLFTRLTRKDVMVKNSKYLL